MYTLSVGVLSFGMFFKVIFLFEIVKKGYVLYVL